VAAWPLEGSRFYEQCVDDETKSSTTGLRGWSEENENDRRDYRRKKWRTFESRSIQRSAKKKKEERMPSLSHAITVGIRTCTQGSDRPGGRETVKSKNAKKKRKRLKRKEGDSKRSRLDYHALVANQGEPIKRNHRGEGAPGVIQRMGVLEVSHSFLKTGVEKRRSRDQGHSD